MLDSSVEPQPCQEMDMVTKEPVGDEHTLEDLITWVKLDVDEVQLHFLNFSVVFGKILVFLIKF